MKSNRAGARLVQEKNAGVVGAVGEVSAITARALEALKA
jgi:hypothetical protein